MPVLFALGFRPFFLLAGYFAIFFMVTWVAVFTGALAFTPYYGELGWHSHEMIFGYTAAVVAGFLFTAVRNWTAKPTPTGVYLAALCVLWLGGRILPVFPAILPAWLIALVDLSFLPLVAIGIGIPLVRAGEKRNLVFLLVLAGLFIGNLYVHLAVLGYSQFDGAQGDFSRVLHSHFADRDHGRPGDPFFYRAGA